ncbi:hypothetical protein SUGI_0521450 [Cryptomeria japonica]|nr:hypothetical protein SUGI_0521450 [Cryptomeria japonica]
MALPYPSTARDLRPASRCKAGSTTTPSGARWKGHTSWSKLSREDTTSSGCTGRGYDFYNANRKGGFSVAERPTVHLGSEIANEVKENEEYFSELGLIGRFKGFWLSLSQFRKLITTFGKTILREMSTLFQEREFISWLFSTMNQIGRRSSMNTNEVGRTSICCF